MFPSQRGNFFPNHTTSTIGTSHGTKSVISVNTSRPKSPPLGVSAINSKNERSGRDSDASGSTEDGTNMSITQGPHGTISTARYPAISLSRIVNTSKHSMFSGPPSPLMPLGKYEPDPSIRRKSSSITTTQQIVLSRIPSSWSNRQWSPAETNFQFTQNKQGILDISSISSYSKAICEEDGKCGNLNRKTQQERLLVKKLCEDAMKSRRDVFAFYSKAYEEEMSETSARLSSFEPKNHKGRLCEFMLKLVLERQQLHDHRKDVVPPPSILKDEKMAYTPVYCVRGKTILGKPSDRINFPNSFAPLSELRAPRNDPKGYRRFCTLVDMKGFTDNEIYLRITGNCLTVDGVHWKKDESKVHTSGARVMSVYIELPNGVYPDHLKIGRSEDGRLVIQEPWKF